MYVLFDIFFIKWLISFYCKLYNTPRFTCYECNNRLPDITLASCPHFISNTMSNQAESCAPQPYPLCRVLLYTKFPSGGECISKEPDTKLGTLAKNGSV